MADEKRVQVIGPEGELASVDEADLAQSLAAGDRLLTPEEKLAAANEAELGGLGGRVATGVLAGARATTLGLSDTLLAEGLGAAAGDEGKTRRDVLKAFSLAKDVNPYSDMAGEAVGLIAGGGGGVTAVGEAAEGAIAARLGEGLLGRAAAMGARGAAEGALIGAQHQISEDTLGDHALNGQAIATKMLQDGLLGGGVGAALGAGAGLLGRARGPLSHAAADELAGAEGAGRKVFDEARRTEEFIQAARKAGATTDQAVKMAEDVSVFSKAGAEGGPVKGLVDQFKEVYGAKVAGNNPELRKVLETAQEMNSNKLVEMRQAFDDNAMKLKTATDRMLKVERAMDEASFTQRPERMAKLVDKSLVNAQMDARALMRQETESLLAEINATAMKGGAEQVSFNRVGKQLIDSMKLGDSPEQIWSGMNKLKQQVGKASGFGIPAHLRTTPQNMMGELYTRIQATLEDATVWGEKAAMSQKAVNEAFSVDFKRSNDFLNRYTVGLDEAKGIPLPEADPQKLRDGLLKKMSSDVDANQPAKSTETWIERNRSRMQALREHGDLTPEQFKILDEGEAALKDFRSTFAKSRDESIALSRLEEQLDREGVNKSMSGLLGLIGDAVTKPATTMRRLADIGHGVQRLEDGIGKLLRRFGEGAGEAAETVAPRGKDVVAKEIGEIRELAGNPQALENRISRMTASIAGVAPKVAEEVANTARRAIYWLDKEAPSVAAKTAVLGIDHRPARFSDKQISDWETKRKAALGAADGTTAPEQIVKDMTKGRLNRDAIKTIEFVSPRLFGRIQELAQYELQRQALDGRLDKMPYAQKAAISTLLHIPADGTWAPHFIDAMQSVKMLPPPEPVPAPGAPPQQQTSKRKIEMNPDVFMTAAGGIEQGGIA